MADVCWYGTNWDRGRLRLRFDCPVVRYELRNKERSKGEEESLDAGVQLASYLG